MGDKRDNGEWTERDTARRDDVTEREVNAAWHQARTDAHRSGYENFGSRKATDSEYDRRWERDRDRDKGDWDRR